MPRILTLAAVGLALLASISVSRADGDTGTCTSPGDTSLTGGSGTQVSTDVQSGITQTSAGTTNTATGDGSSLASSSDADTSGSDDAAAVASGGPAVIAGTAGTDVAYGVFRENLPDAPVNQRNCWVQRMISGQTIGGELLAEQATSTQAQCMLSLMTSRGLCAN